jgi:hypothetical protein
VGIGAPKNSEGRHGHGAFGQLQHQQMRCACSPSVRQWQWMAKPGDRRRWAGPAHGCRCVARRRQVQDRGPRCTGDGRAALLTMWPKRRGWHCAVGVQKDDREGWNQEEEDDSLVNIIYSYYCLSVKPRKGLFGCKCIHFNPHVLECIGMEFSLIPLQHMWIEMNTCVSKQGLSEYFNDCSVQWQVT